jgi:hypothetical protein
MAMMKRLLKKHTTPFQRASSFKGAGSSLLKSVSIKLRDTKQRAVVAGYPRCYGRFLPRAVPAKGAEER